MLTVAMGRRWGKTTMAGALALANAAKGGVVGWVAPTYSNSRPLWRFVERSVVNEPQARVRQAEHTVTFPNGGRLTVFSGDNDVTMRGEAFDFVIIDEAARIREETFSDVLLPTLADRNGRMIAISTPQGRNWFWRQFMAGMIPNDTNKSFSAPSSANPMESIQRACKLAESSVSDRTYRQEWLAEFIDDGAGVFRGIRDCIRPYNPNPEPGKQYVMGVDWGRTNDSTVFTVICVEDSQLVYIDRMSDTAYHLQLDRLRRLSDIWKPYVIIAEANSMGGPLVEALQRMELPVRSFMMTAITKQPLIDSLVLALERQDLGIINDATLLLELQAFESQRLPSGVLRFSAPPGMHDDCVISLSLAWSAAKRSGPMVLFEA